MMIINGHDIPSPDFPGGWYKGWENDYWWPYHKAANKVIDELADPYYFYEHIKWTCFINLTSFIERNKSYKEAKLWVEVYEDYSVHFYIQDLEKEESCLLLNILPPDSKGGKYIEKQYQEWMCKVKDKRIPFKNINKITITDYT